MQQKEFEIRITKVRPRLLKEALQLLKESGEAEDAVQDAILKLWTMRHRLNEYHSMEGLAVVIVRRVALNKLRSRRSHFLWKRDEKPNNEQREALGDFSPEERLIEQEMEIRIHELIDSLPDKQQAILRMKHLDGMEITKRFLNGETTADEEQLLYDFFATDDIPKALHKYKKMFQWYANGMKEPLPAPAKKRTLAVRIAIAASFVALFGIGIIWHKHIENERLYAIYQDSYIVRGGKKITDIKKIQPELERVSNEAAAMTLEKILDEPANTSNLPII